eukprot:2149092-Pyramimonas_sp.AAC.1
MARGGLQSGHWPLLPAQTGAARRAIATAPCPLAHETNLARRVRSSPSDTLTSIKVQAAGRCFTPAAVPALRCWPASQAPPPCNAHLQPINCTVTGVNLMAMSANCNLASGKETELSQRGFDHK